MSFKSRNLYFQLLLFSLIICLSSESELNKLVERRILASTSTETSTSIVPSSTSIGNSTFNPPIIRRSSSGSLSSGAIVGIVVPCVGALLAAGIIAALCRATPTTIPMQQNFPMDMNFMDASLEKFQPPTEQIIVHQQPVVQTEMVQQPVAVVQNPVVAQPVAIVQEPVAMVQQPVAVVQEPVAMVQQPVAVVQEPVAMVQQPVTMVQQPVTVVQQEVPI